MLAAPSPLPRKDGAPQQKPSDWGFGVTVGIASISHPARTIVAVADSMITVGSGEVTADDAALKHHALHQDWFGLFAGDVSPVGPIFRNAATRLEASDTPTVDEVRDAVVAAYQHERMLRAEASVLGPYGLSMREFVTDGVSRLPRDVFRKLSKKIDAVALGCDLMICGFDQIDPKGYPHVFTVTGDAGVTADFFPVGWWAIGSGAMAAISVLAQWQHNFGADIASTIYRLLEAKFAAESALGVGNARTFVLIRQYRTPFVMIDETTVQKVREIWKTKMRIMPPESLELLQDSIQTFIKRGLGR